MNISERAELEIKWIATVFPDFRSTADELDDKINSTEIEHYRIRKECIDALD